MAQKRLSRTQFLERLLAIMDRKHHWAWPASWAGWNHERSTQAPLSNRNMASTCVTFPCSWPAFTARTRRPTSDGCSPKIFTKKTPAGSRFGKFSPGIVPEHDGRSWIATRETLTPRDSFRPVARYRAWLEQVSNSRDWVVGAAALAVFVEGSVKDRARNSEPSKPKTEEEIEAYLQRPSTH